MSMGKFRIIKRYTAYYRGWCIAFGEHKADYEEDRDISWLYGEDKVGLILSSGLLKQMHRALLGHHEEIPQFKVSDNSVSMSVSMNELNFDLADDIDKRGAKSLKNFLRDSQELHMYVCSHLFYPSRTRIITFARKKPIVIMYKEMQPLRLIIE